MPENFSSSVMLDHVAECFPLQVFCRIAGDPFHIWEGIEDFEGVFFGGLLGTFIPGAFCFFPAFLCIPD